MIIYQYKRLIAENRTLAYSSTLIVLLLRVVTFLSIDKNPEYDGGILWKVVSLLPQNEYLSFSLSFFLTVAIAIYITHLNVKYTLIRGKTYLPYIFGLFLLTLPHQIIYLTPYHFSIILVLYAIDLLFKSYQNPKASSQAFKVGSVLALGSLFTPSLLIYIPVFWIGFSLMRSFSIRVLLASLLGAIMVYWLALAYCFQTDTISVFYDGLLIKWHTLQGISLLEMNVDTLIIFIICMITVSIIVIDYYMNEFKDRIRVRAYISSMSFISIFSILIYFMLVSHLHLFLFIALAVGSVNLAHFFALADKKWKIYLFVMLSVFYFSIYFHLLTQI